MTAALQGFSKKTGPSDLDILDLYNGLTDPGFATWDMLTSVGPVSGTAKLLQWVPTVLTDGGQLQFFDGISDATFQAVVVPVPAAVWLLGSALGVLGWAKRKATH